MVVLRPPSSRRRGAERLLAWRWLSGGLTLAAAALPLLAGPLSAQTGPVLCTTTLEAPLVIPGQPLPEGSGPREVTRCGVVATTTDLVRQRYYTYRAPFARGIDITHQITDLFGVAMGGGNGSRIMGLGFPDQAIIWDGTAIENTNRFLMEQQAELVPIRTADLSTPYTTSVRACADPGPSAITCRSGAMDPKEWPSAP
jgi:hypothetical protein